MRISPILTALLVLCIELTAQQHNLTQTIRGRVTDIQSGLPVPGATVFIHPEESGRAVFSDSEGRFRFESLPLGRYEVHVKMLGFQEAILPDIVIGTGKEAVLEVKLTERVQQIKTVEIHANGINKTEAINELATVSARQFSVEETKRYAGALNDPGRMVQSFAGVTMNADGNNEIVVRGNSPRGVLWRLEGIEIPNPNHFSNQGASGGAISMLSNNMMDNSDFFSGAFAAEYGNAASGVFDMRLRNGNNERRESAFQIGVIGTDIALEGPFVKNSKSSYLVNYRYSSLALLQRAGIKIVGDAIPVFQDVSFKMHFPTQKSGTFSLFGIGGLSSINQEFKGQKNNYRNKFNTSLGVAGLSHSYIINSKTWIKSVVAATSTTNKYTGKLLDTNNIFKYNDLEENFENANFRASFNLSHKMNRKNSIKSGLIMSQIQFALYSKAFDKETETYNTNLNRDGHSGLIQGYTNWQHRFSDALSLNLGVHYMHFLLNNRNSFEPRAGLRWNFSGNHLLSAGLGMHSRIEDLSVYFGQRINSNGVTEMPNKQMDLSKSMHYVIGYETMFNEVWHLKSEVYYQRLFDVPVNAEAQDHLSLINLNEGFTNIRAKNTGKGVNVGLELTLEKYFSRNWYTMFTSSLYDSKYRGSDRILRNTAYNGNYAGSFLAGKEFQFSKSRTLSVNVRVIAAGGRRYTPVLEAESIASGKAIYDNSKAYESRGSFYRRVDIGLSYTKNKKQTTRVWKIDIQNAGNRFNEYSRYFNTDTGKVEIATQAGIIPTLSYRIEF